MRKGLSILVLAACLLHLPVLATAAQMKAEIQAGMFGGTHYQLSYALSEVLRKHVPDFKITIVETQGAASSVVKTMADPTKSISASTMITDFDAIEGHIPFKAPVTKLKILCCYTENVHSLIAVNPEIKTLKDLSGKRLGLGPINNPTGRNNWSILSRAIPGSADMKPFYMGWNQLRDALLDSSIDAMVMAVSMRPTGTWSPVPVYQEIAVSRPGVHFIGIPEQAIKEASTADGLPYGIMTIPKNAVAEGIPAEETLGWTDRLGLAASEEFPEETAYTLVKTYYEHFEEMIEYAPEARSLIKSRLLPTDLPEANIHPGTLRLMKELGLR